jgi:cation diffusion facilitator family transporter
MNTQSRQGLKTPEKCHACAKRVPVVCFFSNLTLAVFKMSVGYLTGSKGLFADGIHSLSDVVATTGVIVSLRISEKGEDARYPYGRGKIEFISCVFVYSILFIIAVLILIEAISSILIGNLKAPNMISLFSALVSVTANVILFRLGLCAGRAVNSPAIIANANENKADMLSSIAVIFGIIGANLGYPIADPLAAIVVGLIILRTSSTLGWRAIKALVDTSLPAEKLKAINGIILEVPGVEKVNYIKTRQLGKKFWLDIEIRVSPDILVREGDVISKVVKYEIMRISHRIRDVVVIQSCRKNNDRDSPRILPIKTGRIRSRFNIKGVAKAVNSAKENIKWNPV